MRQFDFHTACLELQWLVSSRGPLAQGLPKLRISETDPDLSLTRIAEQIGAGYLTVWSAHSEHTIYGNALTNCRFRLWHDFTHHQMLCGFGFHEEMAVAYEHQREAAKHVSPLACAVLWADTYGQSAYAEQHHGAFPEDQLTFVKQYLGVY